MTPVRTHVKVGLVSALLLCTAVALVLSSRTIRTEYHKQAYKRELGRDTASDLRLRGIAGRIGIELPSRRLKPLNLQPVEYHLQRLVDLGVLSHEALVLTNWSIGTPRKRPDFSTLEYEYVGKYFEGKADVMRIMKRSETNVVHVFAPPGCISQYVARFWMLDAALGRPVEPTAPREPLRSSPVGNSADREGGAR